MTNETCKLCNGGQDKSPLMVYEDMYGKYTPLIVDSKQVPLKSTPSPFRLGGSK